MTIRIGKGYRERQSRANSQTEVAQSMNAATPRVIVGRLRLVPNSREDFNQARKRAATMPWFKESTHGPLLISGWWVFYDHS